MEEFKIEEYIPPTTKIPFQSNKEYHVFLSFRGEDVRKNLVDHLYEALTVAGLNVFLDTHKLKKGEIIGLSLERAVESSAIRIPIFSKGYADSAWCLKEAATMVNTQGLVIPLFYDVDPTHVRYPQGNSSPYKQAFLRHYSHSDHIQREEIEWWKYALQQICPCLQLYGHSVRHPREEIDGWKNALKEICSHSGWSKDLTGGGEDVRKNLVDHLYQALTVAGLNVFLDTHKLKKGEIIELSLERAVESSAIRIPVFSRGYAESTWCLKEAATMVNTQGLIIPLFYDVDPTHVRYPLGNSSPYKQAFLRHYSHSDHIQREEIEWWKYALQQICPCLQLYGHSVRHPREEIDGWKNALKEICSHSGWSKDLTGGFEAQLVKRVVNDIIKTLDRVPLEVAKHPVGLESLTDDLIHKFELNSKGGVVKSGLWGIGGIGKTTAAKAVYNQVFADFDSASFVFNVRATSADAKDLAKLQRKIIKDVTKCGEEVDSVDEGKSLMRDRLGGKRLLLILDDVDNDAQLNALVGDWLAPGSRLIITSRDRHILHLAGVSAEFIHEMSGLQINEGLKLFSWHAFLRESPILTHHDLSKRIVEACKGHPLSLEVIGSFLYDKQNDPDCWAEAVDNITLHADIQKTLYISYNALSEQEKEIFLDIACFFIGEDKRYPIVFWKSMHRMVHTAISNLTLKLLIKIDDNGEFNMHDHLRDMGRTIAEKE